MPYVNNEERARITRGEIPLTAGQLNYKITLMVIEFLGRKGAPRYQDFNDAIGALEGAKMELYRRKVASYEDAKRDENGEVYF